MDFTGYTTAYVNGHKSDSKVYLYVYGPGVEPFKKEVAETTARQALADNAFTFAGVMVIDHNFTEYWQK